MTAEQHKGHRERLRERFEKGGFGGFHDYEVLEMLLTFIFRQGDVKPLAKELIKTFGSFSKVLDAPVEELQNVSGMGKVSALSLHAFREVLAYYFQNHATTDKAQITKMSALIEMLRASIGHKQNEILFAIFLNAKNEVLATKELGEGTLSQASAFPRKIVEEALKQKATSLILAHNHPGGIAEPSEHDESITAEIQKALALVEISLQDHIILANDEYYSFKRNNLI
ncbi:MAG: DNA repair protein RadC [Saprospiraceae bacterium]|nr:DNA repair protein RadC [Saprospiraceae bacterium]